MRHKFSYALVMVFMYFAASQLSACDLEPRDYRLLLESIRFNWFQELSIAELNDLNIQCVEIAPFVITRTSESLYFILDKERPFQRWSPLGVTFVGETYDPLVRYLEMLRRKSRFELWADYRRSWPISQMDFIIDAVQRKDLHWQMLSSEWKHSRLSRPLPALTPGDVQALRVLILGLVRDHLCKLKLQWKYATSIDIPPLSRTLERIVVTVDYAAPSKQVERISMSIHINPDMLPFVAMSFY